MTDQLLYGPDIWSGRPLDDARATRDAGNDFIFVKCTGGLSYENPLYGDQCAKTRAAGLELGHYHFLHETDSDPEERQEDYVTQARMEAEADHFFKYLDWREGEPIAVDVEDKRVAVEQSQAVLWFADRITQHTGLVPLMYTYPYYKQDYLRDRRLTRLPLWWADYDDAYATDPWPTWTVRQYTASERVPGIDNPKTDRNIFRGTRANFRALGMPQGSRPSADVARAVIDFLGAIWR